MTGEQKALHKAYHDKHYGFPIHDDNELFGRLIMEINQAGLSWEIILKKEAGFRKAYHNFQIKKIAAYTESDRKRLLNDAGIIRNRLKITSVRDNARAALDVIDEHGSLDKYLWSFVDGKPIRNARRGGDVPATTPVSDRMSKTLGKRGFRFVGSTICYAFMQATGMVDDHLVTCFRYNARKKAQ